MKLHGHHHSDHEGGASHNHGTPDNATEAMGHDQHQVRYIDFEFARNRIVDDGFGLRYNDQNHAGDDRTATSEKEPDLELPHVHHTRIHIRDNVIDGATLRVVVVNAEDERHLPGESAELDVENNTISGPHGGDGIQVQAVRDASVRVAGNRVAGPASSLFAAPCAILLSGFHNATVLVEENALGAWRYGVCGSRLDATTRWTVRENDASSGATQAVYWDSTVANPPDGDAPPADHDHGHEDASAFATPALSILDR
jgi:hypothetical protein